MNKLICILKRISFLSVVLLLLSTTGLFSQIIESPFFERVTVDTSDHKPVLHWSVQQPELLDAYIIKRWLIDQPNYNNNFHTIDTIEDTNIFSYKDLTTEYGESIPDERSERYLIAAYSIINSEIIYSFSIEHQTIYLETEYDYCKKRNSLNWNKYTGWGSNFIKYQIFCKKNSGSYIMIGENQSQSDTFFYHNNAEINSVYQYYIRAVRNDNEESLSNISFLETRNIDLPDFLNADSIIAEMNDYVDLYFEIDNNSDITGYNLLKFNNHTQEYDSINSYSANDKRFLNFRDYEFNASENCRYFLAAKDICEDPIITSDTMFNIYLNVETKNNNPRANILYRADEFNYAQYDVYRDYNNGLILIDQITEDQYEDDISDIFTDQLSSGARSGEFCYYLETKSDNYLSRSNKACVIQEELHFLPNAFNPYSNIEENRTFKPKAAFLTDYQLTVYGPYGSIIFESKDPSLGWDGKFPDGSLAPRAAYLYYISFKDANGNKLVKNLMFL